MIHKKNDENVRLTLWKQMFTAIVRHAQAAAEKYTEKLINFHR